MKYKIEIVKNELKNKLAHFDVFKYNPLGNDIVEIGNLYCLLHALHCMDMDWDDEEDKKLVEFLSDLKQSIAKIDFKNFNALSRDVMSAVNIYRAAHAEMHEDMDWHDDEECEEYMHEHEKHEEHKKKIDVDDDHDKHSENYEIFKHIQEELRDAEKYYQMYLHQGKDASIKKVALQECEHANLFINQMRMAQKDSKEQAKLHTLIQHYNELKTKISEE